MRRPIMAIMWLNKGIRNLGSGIWVQASGVMFFLRNFFYTFVKNIFLKLD